MASTAADRGETLAEHLARVDRELASLDMELAGAKPSPPQAAKRTELLEWSNSLRTYIDFGAPANLRPADLPAVPDDLGGRGNGPAEESVLLASGGTWRLLGLATHSIVPVPRGWEVYDGGESLAVFPVKGMKPGDPLPKGDDVFWVKFAFESRPKFDANYAEAAAKVRLTPGVELSAKFPLEGEAGYFALRHREAHTLTVFIFVPHKKSDQPGTWGFCCVARATEARSARLGPIFEVMMNHWYDRVGNQLARGFRYENVAPKAP